MLAARGDRWDLIQRFGEEMTIVDGNYLDEVPMLSANMEFKTLWADAVGSAHIVMSHLLSFGHVVHDVDHLESAIFGHCNKNVHAATNPLKLYVK